MAKISFSGGFEYEEGSLIVSLNMYVFKEGMSYIVYCPALDLSAYGNTEDEAKKAFHEIFELTLKYMLNKKTLKEDLIKHGWEIKSLEQRKIKAPSFDIMLQKNRSFKELLSTKEYATYKQNVEIPQMV
jgi:hypothetical protein